MIGSVLITVSVTRSITPIVPSLLFPTYAIVPSGEIATPQGPEPTGMVSTTAPASITDTVSSSKLVTSTRPSARVATNKGPAPTAIGDPTGVSVATSITT